MHTMKPPLTDAALTEHLNALTAEAVLQLAAELEQDLTGALAERFELSTIQQERLRNMSPHDRLLLVNALRTLGQLRSGGQQVVFSTVGIAPAEPSEAALRISAIELGHHPGCSFYIRIEFD
jgi:hypothetical protein